MSEEMKQALVKREETAVEYIPYGAQDKIKLNVKMVQNLIAVPTKSGKTCSDRDAIKFLAMCTAKRLNPFEGDAFLIGYDGKDGPVFSLITAHQTYLKRAELNAEFNGMKSGIIVLDDGKLIDLEGDFFMPDQKVLGAWATVFFKSRQYPMHKRVRLERFRKPFGLWLDDAAGMCCKCAEADALRSSFPTMLGGLYMREELESPEATPQFSKPIFSQPVAQVGNGGDPELILHDPGQAIPMTAPEPEPPKPDPMVQDWDRQPSTPPAAASKPTPAPAPKRATTPAAAPKPAAAPAPASGAFNTVKAIRGLCRQDKITDQELITFLTDIGSCDEGVTTLEQLVEKHASTADMVCGQWGDVSDKIRSARVLPETSRTP